MKARDGRPNGHPCEYAIFAFGETCYSLWSNAKPAKEGKGFAKEFLEVPFRGSFYLLYHKRSSFLPILTDILHPPGDRLSRAMSAGKKPRIAAASSLCYNKNNHFAHALKTRWDVLWTINRGCG